MRELTSKEQLFCTLYSHTRNAKESVVRAGYNSLFPERTGEKLLSDTAITEQIKVLEKAKQASFAEVCAGLRRLAFGSVNDAVKLLYKFDELDDKSIDSLDLFNVADIKKPKGGGIEIKFFDRQKALEKLLVVSCEQKDNEVMPFYEALERSAGEISLDTEDGADE